jgi:hypothetical protein
MMETFAAIVVAAVVVPVVLLGIILVPVLLVFILSFLSTKATAPGNSSSGSL